jgi:biotin carboxyl carrier protein
MKMERALTTPFAGVVAEFVANIGGQVEVRRRITRVEAWEAVEAVEAKA